MRNKRDKRGMMQTREGRSRHNRARCEQKRDKVCVTLKEETNLHGPHYFGRDSLYRHLTPGVEVEIVSTFTRLDGMGSHPNVRDGLGA